MLEVSTVRVDFKMESMLGHSRKNQIRKKGKNGKRPLEFLDLSLFPWKFQTKWSFTPGSSTKLCYIHWNFMSKTKNQDPWKFHIIFSGSPFEIPLFYWPLEFRHSIFFNPGTFMSSTFAHFNVFCNRPLKVRKKNKKYIYVKHIYS